MRGSRALPVRSDRIPIRDAMSAWSWSWLWCRTGVHACVEKEKGACATQAFTRVLAGWVQWQSLRRWTECGPRDSRLPFDLPRAHRLPPLRLCRRVQQGGRSGDDKQENPGTHVLRGVWCVYVLVAAHAYTARRRPPPASLGVASHVVPYH